MFDSRPCHPTTCRTKLTYPLKKLHFLSANKVFSTSSPAKVLPEAIARRQSPN
jgi:hypothetical protein